MDPGLFYRFRFGRDVEFICLDTSKEGFFRGKRLYEYPKHWEWIEQTFVPAPGVRWRLPFCHHPPFCAGPRHHNTDRMERLLPLFTRGGVRAVFSWTDGPPAITRLRPRRGRPGDRAHDIIRGP